MNTFCKYAQQIFRSQENFFHLFPSAFFQVVCRLCR